MQQQQKSKLVVTGLFLFVQQFNTVTNAPLTRTTETGFELF